MVSASRTVTICGRGSDSSRLTQAAQSSANTSASTPRILSNSGLLKDGSLRVSVTACLPGRMVVEIGREPLQEARHAKQRHRAREDEEAALEVLAEQAAAQGARLKLGRASCRERVCQYVSISVVADPVQKKTKYITPLHQSAPNKIDNTNKHKQ